MSSSSSNGPAQTNASPEWLQHQLETLLKSPYIHFNKPKLLGIRMGHGPVDLFSTRFNNFFTGDATGVVAGREVDKNGLKEALLALQKKWSRDSAHFEHEPASNGGKITTKCAWTLQSSDKPAAFTASADVTHEGGSQRIKSLTLHGDESLFTK